MPLDPVTGSLIVAGASLLGQGTNAYAQGKMNKKTRQWNEKMHNLQRSEALSDYQMQNEYNHPDAVMKRYREAKLNPNLIYGNGTNAEAASVRPASVEGWNPKPIEVDPGGATAAGIGAYQDLQLRQAQVDNLRVQNTVLEQDKLLRAAQVINTTASTGHTQASTAETLFDTQLKKELKETSIAAATAGVEKVRADTKSTLDENDRRAAMQAPNLAAAAEAILKSRSERAKTDEEKKLIHQQIENLKKDATLKDLDINLKKQGIQPGDEIYWRVLAQAMKGFKLSDLGDPNKMFNRKPLTPSPDMLKRWNKKK